MIPDLATLRDRSESRVGRIVYGILAMGWRGSAQHWLRYEKAYLLLAGLATPLVVSVHTVVSFGFSVAILPGWHSTIFPPYFVAGALFSGFAMVLTLVIPVRYFYGLEDFVTLRHLQNMAKIMLATGLIVTYGYVIEGFMAWYSGNGFEQYMTLNRMFGPYAVCYWTLIGCNCLAPLLLWLPRIRSNVPLLFVISIVVNIGMWMERFVIVVTSLHHLTCANSWASTKLPSFKKCFRNNPSCTNPHFSSTRADAGLNVNTCAAILARPNALTACRAPRRTGRSNRFGTPQGFRPPACRASTPRRASRTRNM